MPPARPRATPDRSRVTVPAMRAGQVLDAVRELFGAQRDTVGPEWAALDEFTLAPGVGLSRADLFLVRAWSGRPRGHERVVVEVKVSRADLTRELANPAKLAAWTAVAHRTFLATPAGLVRDGDVLPEGVGLLEVSPSGRATQVRAARRTRDEAVAQLPASATVEAFRRAARAEARIRGAGDDPAAELAAATAQLAAATARADRAVAAAARDRDRFRALLSTIAHAAPAGVPCTCGASLGRTPTKAWVEYRHADDSVCPSGYARPDLEALAELLGLAPTGGADAG